MNQRMQWTLLSTPHFSVSLALAALECPLIHVHLICLPLCFLVFPEEDSGGAQQKQAKSCQSELINESLQLLLFCDSKPCSGVIWELTKFERPFWFWRRCTAVRDLSLQDLRGQSVLLLSYRSFDIECYTDLRLKKYLSTFL